MLFGLSPGTHNFENPQYQRPYDLVTHNLYANGSPQVAELNIDGVTNEAGGTGGAAGFVPSVDVLGEYKIVLNPYDASYSHGGGNSIDMSLKSGSNPFHGRLTTSTGAVGSTRIPGLTSTRLLSMVRPP